VDGPKEEFMRVRTLVVALVVGSVGFFAGRAFTEEEAPDAEAMKAAFEALAKPGPQHEQLMAFAGTWSIQGKDWFTGKEQAFTSTAKFTKLLGGRYVREEISGKMSDGSAFEGVGHHGFDNATQKFVGSWIDNMGTGIMTSTGTYDAATKTYTYDMTSSGPGGMEMKFRATLQVKSDKEHVFTMHTDMGKGEQKVMEMTYTRTS
jgi:hypothetical protein